MGGSHTLGRIAPFLERVEQLLDSPHDLGFLLLGTPDPRVFEELPTGSYGSGTGTGTTGTGPGDPTPAPTGGPDPVDPGNIPVPEGCAEIHGDDRDRVREVLETLRGIARFDEGSARRIDCALLQAPRFPGDRIAHGVDALSSLASKDSTRALEAFLLHSVIRLHHGVAPDDLSALLQRFDVERISQVLHENGPTGLHLLVPKKAATGTSPSTTATSTGPDPGPDEIPVNEVQQLSGYFDDLHKDHQAFEVCMSILERLQKDFLRYKRTSASEVTDLDLSEMKELGILREIPFCPGGGTYQIVGLDTLGCNVHGTRPLPWAKYRAYQRYFKRWEVAREALEAGRPAEARFTVRPLLEKQPLHGWLLEIEGEAAFKLEKFKEAAQAFYAIAKDIWTADAFHIYHAGMAFYAAGNDSLATEMFDRLLEKSTFQSSRRRIPTRFEFFRLRERATWMLETFLRPTRPDGTPAPPVRWLEFRVAREPEWQVEACRRLLGATRDRLYEFVADYYKSPVLRRLYQELKTQQDRAKSLQPFEVEERERAQAEIQDLEAKIARFRKDEGFASSGNVIRDLSKMIRDEGVDAHPGANYRLSQRLDLHCSAHPHLLDDPSVAPQLTVTEEERDRLNVSLSFGILARDTVKAACFDRLRRSSEAWGTSPSGRFDARAVAVQLGLAGPADADCPAPARGGFQPAPRGERRGLVCRTHGDRERFLDPRTDLPDGEAGR